MGPECYGRQRIRLALVSQHVPRHQGPVLEEVMVVVVLRVLLELASVSGLALRLTPVAPVSRGQASRLTLKVIGSSRTVN